MNDTGKRIIGSPLLLLCIDSCVPMMSVNLSLKDRDDGLSHIPISLADLFNFLLTNSWYSWSREAFLNYFMQTLFNYFGQ